MILRLLSLRWVGFGNQAERSHYGQSSAGLLVETRDAGYPCECRVSTVMIGICAMQIVEDEDDDSESDDEDMVPPPPTFWTWTNNTVSLLVTHVYWIDLDVWLYIIHWIDQHACALWSRNEYLSKNYSIIDNGCYILFTPGWFSPIFPFCFVVDRDCISPNVLLSLKIY